MIKISYLKGIGITEQVGKNENGKIVKQSYIKQIVEIMERYDFIQFDYVNNTDELGVYISRNASGTFVPYKILLSMEINGQEVNVRKLKQRKYYKEGIISVKNEDKLLKEAIFGETKVVSKKVAKKTEKKVEKIEKKKEVSDK